MSSLQKEGIEQNNLQNIKSPENSTSISIKKLNRINSVNILRQKEKNWDERFIYNKMPEYDSFKDKNVLINLSIKSYSGRKDANLKNIPDFNAQNLYLNKINNYNSFYLYARPLSNKIYLNQSYINGKYSISTTNTKIKNINFNNNIYIDNNNKNENINNINKLWDELSVSNKYRKLFCTIINKLNSEDRDEFYKREENELNSIKNNINSLKSNIELRLNIIEEISELNKKLNEEILNENNSFNKDKNKYIINDISKKIELLREHTINICSSMKKLKYELNGIKYLNKYDIDIISQKFNFDKHYVVKMKGELNFLKEGFATHYLNIKNDQTPFLLKTSEKIEAENEKDKNENRDIHIVPLKNELKNDILDCTYYIYQELIAYQNEKINRSSIRCISPFKKSFNNTINISNNNRNNKILNLKKSSSAFDVLTKNENKHINSNINYFRDNIISKENNIFNKKKINVNLLKLDKKSVSLYQNREGNNKNNDNKKILIRLKSNLFIGKNNLSKEMDINKNKINNVKQNMKKIKKINNKNNDDKKDNYNNKPDENEEKDKIKDEHQING